VVVAARRMPLLKQAVDECAARGGNAIAIQVDVSDPKSVDSLARQANEG
jgi:NADP-dependent 3-hydroxy acid dehydrogenase YdfG